jgi:preprotein translocase subunit YajC
MEWITFISQAVSSYGFPIVGCLLIGVFMFYIYKDWSKQNAERENKLYGELAKNREVIDKALTTMGSYNERLGVVEEDVKDIKEMLK